MAERLAGRDSAVNPGKVLQAGRRPAGKRTAAEVRAGRTVSRVSISPYYKGEIFLVLRRLPSQAQREIFGNIIRGARNRRGLTQEDLAELMGCSAHWIHKVERGKSDLNWMDTLRLTVILDLNAAEIVEEVNVHVPIPAHRK